MKVFLDGWNRYQIHDITDDDLKSLLRMIASACLDERRHFHDLKVQIERLTEQKNA